MYREADFRLEGDLPSNEPELTQDLGLAILFQAMSQGDGFLVEVSRRALLSSLHDLESITYRQDILEDCLAHPEVIRLLYALATEAVDGEKKIFEWMLSKYPEGILHRAIQVLELFIGLLERLRHIVEEQGAGFSSEGLTTLCSVLTRELDDEYFEVIRQHLKRLRFQDGVWLSAQLGRGNKGVGHVLRAPGSSKQGFKERLGLEERRSYSFAISDRDEAGARALAELRGRGINLVANALATSTDHILSFFSSLRAELGFYVGCLNLHQLLRESGEPTCRAVPVPWRPAALSFRGLYDVCLTLRTEGRVVGNDGSADGKSLVVITGANSGGKSTFLRSLGLAQMMMKCGMFVGAKGFRASLDDGLFTHFVREEDATMTSGRLDEELTRMSVIADAIPPQGVVLFNESFAATNSREGSQIAHEIVLALLEVGIKIFFVTHLFDLANDLCSERRPEALFLRAERQVGGRRSYKIVEGEPLPTSYGEDLYQRIGGFTTMAPRGGDRGGIS